MAEPPCLHVGVQVGADSAITVGAKLVLAVGCHMHHHVPMYHRNLLTHFVCGSDTRPEPSQGLSNTSCLVCYHTTRMQTVQDWAAITALSGKLLRSETTCHDNMHIDSSRYNYVLIGMGP